MIKKIIILLGMLVFLIGSLSFVCCGEVGGETTEIIDIGELIGIGVEKIFGSGINYDKDLIKDFETKNSLNINDDKFENIVPGSVSGHPTYIRLKSGNIESADITISKESVYTFNGKPTPFSVPAGSRIIFMNDEITVEFPDNGEIKEFSNLNLGETYLTKIRGKNVKLPGEHFLGSGDLYYNGKLFVKAGDETIIDNIQFYELEDNVNLYFEKDFNPSKHQNENYFNYGEDKVSLGGYGFTSNIGVNNGVFEGDFQVVDLEVTMEGGTLEISRDKSKSELAFIVESTGKSKLSNGRTVFVLDQEFIQQDGKTVLSDKSKLFVKTDFSQSFSHDIIINGDFVLSDNLIQNDKGGITYKGVLPWENTAYNRQNSYTTEEDIAKIEAITGKGTFKNWNYKLTDVEFNKEIFKSAESANLNKYDIIVSAPEVAATAAGEGWFYSSGEGILSDWEEYTSGTEVFYAGGIGLTGIMGYFEKLKEGDFISSDSSLIYYDFGGTTRAKIKDEDIFEFLAGTLAYFKWRAKKAVGEEVWNTLTDSKKFALTTHIYNSGKPAGEDIYNPVNVEEGYIKDSALKNAKIREAIYLDFKDYFDYP